MFSLTHDCSWPFVDKKDLTSIPRLPRMVLQARSLPMGNKSTVLIFYDVQPLSGKLEVQMLSFPSGCLRFFARYLMSMDESCECGLSDERDASIYLN